MNDYPILNFNGIRVQVLGDQHLGRKFVSGVPLHRRGDREHDVVRHFQDHMSRIDCDLHVNMGDVFDKPVVAPDYVKIVADSYIAAVKANPKTTFVIIEGNHDKGKDEERTTSFDLLARILKPFDKIIVVQNECMIWSATNGPTFLFVPWQAKVTTEELINQFHEYLGWPDLKYQAVFGHWDVIAVSDTSNLVPLDAINAEVFITGHDHKRRDDGKVLVVGSMQPYAHGEDWTGTMYQTLTLAELEMISVEDRKRMCLRVVLAEGETLPEGIDAYQVTIMREKKDGSMDLEVSMDGLDMGTVWKDTFAEFGVSPKLSESLLTKFRER